MKSLAESNDIDFGIIQVKDGEFIIVYSGEKRSFKLVPLDNLEASAIFQDLSLFLVRAGEAGKKK